jgi:ketosteroid isomerase-like protein
MSETQWIYDVVAAIAAHDGEKAAAFFAEDGCFEAVSVGLKVSGRSAIAEMLGPGSDGFSKDDSWKLSPL